MQEKLTILNAFVHDVATGTWIGSLVLLSILHAQATQPEWILAAGPGPAAGRASSCGSPG